MKYFGAAVRETIPAPPMWEFTYINWWGQGEAVTILGTEAECREQQFSVEDQGWAAYCQGYGPDSALTVYIGPKR